MQYVKKYTRREPDWLTPWLDMAEGRLTIHAAIRDVIREAIMGEVMELLAEHGFVPAEAEAEPHRDARDRRAEFSMVMEKLRNMPSMEAARKIDKYFRDLTPEDRTVLLQLQKRPSLQHLAEEVRMPVEQFTTRKMNLPDKLA